MLLKIMNTKALEYIKSNISSLTSYYVNGDNPEVWLRERLGESPFTTIEYLEDLPDFELIINENNPSDSDVENIKIFYSNLISLNDSFASDERLWAGLSHTTFYDYLQKRWSFNDSHEKQKRDVLNHYFFNNGKQRSYMVNTLARLWWFGRKIYQPDNANPYYILDYISHDINGYGFTLFGSNWSNNSRNIKLFFDAILKFNEEYGMKVGRTLFNEARKYINCLGGIYIIDACEDDFLVDKIFNFLKTNFHL